MPTIYSITQINAYIQGRMNEDPMLAQVAVRGEISNYKLYPSGHHYFTLKDEQSALKCVMFKGNAMSLRFRPASGMKVIALGRISVYPRDGQYQLYVSSMAMDGIGDLYAAFEALKKKLSQQGLFDPAKKKPIPKYPQTIGALQGQQFTIFCGFCADAIPCAACVCCLSGSRERKHRRRSPPLSAMPTPTIWQTF